MSDLSKDLNGVPLTRGYTMMLRPMRHFVITRIQEEVTGQHEKGSYIH